MGKDFIRRTGIWLTVAVCLSLAFFMAAVCWTQALAEASENEKPAAAGKYPAFGTAQPQAVLEQGKKVYTTYCVGCHGVQGDGNGPASPHLDPKPRNFTLAQFRFASRPSGELPTDEDLFRTVTEGLRGTSMPGWPLVPEADRRAVIAYIKTFAKDRWENASSSAPTVIADDPYYGQDKSDAVKRGESVYHGIAQCYSCHAGYLEPEKINQARAVFNMGDLEGYRTDLGRSRVIQNEDGTSIKPPDFTWDRLKRGTDERTLYHVIGNGIGGVAMPTWKGVFSEEDLWSLVYYVRHLTTLRPNLVTDSDLKAREENFKDLERKIEQYNDRVKAELEKNAAAEAEKVAAEQNQPAAAVTA